MIIPSNFTIPDTCTHRWIFVAGPLRTQITGVKGAPEVQMDDFQTGQPIPDDMRDMGNTIKSLHLDWIQESVEHLRRICGGNP